LGPFYSIKKFLPAKNYIYLDMYCRTEVEPSAISTLLYIMLKPNISGIRKTEFSKNISGINIYYACNFGPHGLPYQMHSRGLE